MAWTYEEVILINDKVTLINFFLLETIQPEKKYFSNWYLLLKFRDGYIEIIVQVSVMACLKIEGILKWKGRGGRT